MNYKVDWMNWFESGISLTDDDIDNETVFPTFGEAKNKLLSDLQTVKSQMNDRINGIRSLSSKQFHKDNYTL